MTIASAPIGSAPSWPEGSTSSARPANPRTRPASAPPPGRPPPKIPARDANHNGGGPHEKHPAPATGASRSGRGPDAGPSPSRRGAPRRRGGAAPWRETAGGRARRRRWPGTSTPRRRRSSPARSRLWRASLSFLTTGATFPSRPERRTMLDRQTIEERQRDRAAALEDLNRAKRELAQAAARLAEREQQLADREKRLEQRMHRIARKLEARRERQHRISALRAKVSHTELLKGRQKRKEPELDRGEKRISPRESELERRARQPAGGRASSPAVTAMLSPWTSVRPFRSPRASTRSARHRAPRASPSGTVRMRR